MGTWRLLTREANAEGRIDVSICSWMGPRGTNQLEGHSQCHSVRGDEKQPVAHEWQGLVPTNLWVDQ